MPASTTSPTSWRGALVLLLSRGPAPEAQEVTP